jgi:hypothetical protein
LMPLKSLRTPNTWLVGLQIKWWAAIHRAFS